jgi:peptidoglycan/xylan/chitin deacetylase (PgdA/CDA1 family)
MTAMAPAERLEFSSIETRQRLRAPNGARVILWPVFALEVWDIGRAMARTVLPPPQHQPLIPDVPNWTWHEYGMRVGFWRLRKMFQQLGVSPTVTLNARVCLEYPQVAAACREAGWELNAHAYEQVPMHKLEDQRASIFKTLEVIEKFSGKRPRGWFGPGLTQTFDTIDYLAEAGIEYIGDWVLDDQPCVLKTRHRPIVALPYNFEVHDIAMMAIQQHESSAFLRRATDQFDCLYEEGEQHPRVMALAVHPYLSGAPHRIKYVRQAFDYCMAKPGVHVADGEHILDWFAAESGLRSAR